LLNSFLKDVFKFFWKVIYKIINLLRLSYQVNSGFDWSRSILHETRRLIRLIETNQFELRVRLPLPVLLPGAELPRADQVIRAGLPAKV
jgi:hypothetical protein